MKPFFKNKVDVFIWNLANKCVYICWVLLFIHHCNRSKTVYDMISLINKPVDFMAFPLFNEWMLLYWGCFLKGAAG